MKKIIVIGGGPAGIMAAGEAAKRGYSVTVIEKNALPLKKLLITGKGRCNITNACDDPEELIKNMTKNASFMYSAFYGFTNLQTIEFMEDIGVLTKVERGNRVFPVSDKSKTVADALIKWAEKCGVSFENDRVLDIKHCKNKITSVISECGGEIFCDAVILATGGVSYPKTGSTGDGFLWAKKLGHTVCKPIPSLVPLETEEDWSFSLAGLSLKNIGFKILDRNGKNVYSDFGELMFTHSGLTGPVVLSASAHTRPMEEGRYRAVIDLKPALDAQKLDERILRDFKKNLNNNLDNALFELLPQNLIEPIIDLAYIDPKKKVNSVTREERARLAETIKNLEFTIVGFAPIEQAIITSGGVDTREIDPSSMRSKIVENLFFAGEIIDVDAYTGGFNLQIAFSTGYIAGNNV